MAVEMRLRTLLMILAVCVIALAAMLIFTPLGFLLVRVDQNPGPFNRKDLETVVEEIRIMGLKPNSETELRLDTLSDPKSLRPLKKAEHFYAGQGAGRVWAEASPDGKLKVAIETRDLGHAGYYGFAYSDVPLSPQRDNGGWFSIAVPGPLTSVQPSMKIDEHWWKVETSD
jgi:hypothetical protein